MRTRPLIVRQAAILVGGKGTRLGALTRSVPKPLVEIEGERCFLDYVIDDLARQGFNDILLLAGYLGPMVQKRYDGKVRRGARISVVIEPEPLGTAGALKAAHDRLAPRFLMLNGDSYFDFNIRSFVTEAQKLDATAVLALREVGDARRYGTVEVEGSRVTRFVEKNAASAAPALISAGFYLLDRALVDEIATLPASIEVDVFPRLASEGRLSGLVQDGYFIDIGLPETLEEARRELPRLTKRRAVFLDRDGVLNEDTGYVHTAEGWSWQPGALEAIRRINDLGRLAIVVTNQAGVAHGLYDEETVRRLHDWVQAELNAAGAFIDAFYYCPYHPEAEVEAYRADHPDRKPKPGMILRALADWPIEPDGSFLIGDRPTDVEAARRAGIAGHIYTGGDLREFVTERARASTRSGKGRS